MNNPIFGLLKQDNINKLHLNEKDARKGFYKNDIILILPWRFQKKILKKHKNKFSKSLETIQVWPYFKKLKI